MFPDIKIYEKSFIFQYLEYSFISYRQILGIVYNFFWNELEDPSLNAEVIES